MELFTLEQKLSSNDLSESWLARHKRNDRHCFLKIPTNNHTLGKPVIEAILRTSLTCQKQLHNSHILTAVRRHSHNNEFCIEYPYLEKDNWRELSTDLFWEHYPESLIQMCLIIDYVHLQGLVHGDIKLQNFQISDGAKGANLLLIDLDFLMKANAPVNARIFGTRDFIAPEISNNDTALSVSDNYSLGVALQRLPDIAPDLSPPHYPARETVARLATFAEALTAQTALQRPPVLIEALHQHGIIDDRKVAALRKKLFSMQVFGNFKIHRHRLLHGKDWLFKFIQKENHAFGFPDELLHDLQKMATTKPRQVFGILTTLIKQADIHSYGDYWHLKFADQDVHRALNTASPTPIGKATRQVLAKMDAADDLDELMDIMADLQDNNCLLRTYLNTKEELEKHTQEKTSQSNPVLKKMHRKLIMLSTAAGRLQEALEHCAKTLQLQDQEQVQDFQFLFLYAYNMISAGKVQEAEKLLNRGVAESEKAGSTAAKLTFQRLIAYLMVTRGECLEAKALLTDILQLATSNQLYEEVVKIQTIMGHLYVCQGEYARAEQVFQQALQVQKKHGITGDLHSLYITIASLYNNTSQYKKAIKFTKLAITTSGSQAVFHQKHTVYGLLCGCHVALSEFDKAEYWLNMILFRHRYQIDRSHFIQFYEHQANYYLKRGLLDAAEQSVLKAHAYYNSNLDKTPGFCYRALAWINAYRGDYDRMMENLESFRSIFGKHHNESFLAEADYTELLCGLPLHAVERRPQMLAILKKLVDNNSRGFAVRCLLLVFLYGTEIDRQEALCVMASLLPLIKKQETPIFRAAQVLIDTEADPDQAKDNDVDAYKKAYLQLYQSGAKYLALLVCLHIAEYYVRKEQPKQAANFLKQSLRICRELDNDVIQQHVEKRLSATSDLKREDRALMVESLLSISRILQHVDQYEQALKELVTYAVHMTGAERGVILLRSKESTALNIKAAVGCDDDEKSLADIRSFSENIPKDVAEALQPVVVENALKDKRTKDYKSIIAHNILSVICVPIKIGANAFGVLYLDHHTIPALFDKDDVIFISSISNFMSVLLNTIQEFRDMKQEQEQQAKELQQMGATHHFITQNKSMLKLLGDIPLMAKSRATILITGESGTGKEILANEIHRQSGRKGNLPVKINCAAIQPNMIESELFGVGPKAFTDVNEREGKFTIADGGTVFLDEIGDMPLSMQAKLFTVIEYKTFSPVGSNRIVSPDICFICATNQDLTTMVKNGKFREELLNRINTIKLEIPPLRERPEDVRLLIDYYVGVFAKNGASPPVFTEDALSALTSYSWQSGNVRQLRNVVERICILSPGKSIGLDDLSPEILAELKNSKKAKHRRNIEERAKICHYLRINKGNQAQTARDLNMSYAALRRRTKKYGITKKDWS